MAGISQVPAQPQSAIPVPSAAPAAPSYVNPFASDPDPMAPMQAAPQAGASPAPYVNPFANDPDPMAPQPAGAVTPQGNDGILGTARDMGHAFAATSVSIGKAGIGLLQLMARHSTGPSDSKPQAPLKTLNGMALEQPPGAIRNPMLDQSVNLPAADSAQINTQVNKSLLGSQRSLAALQNNLTSSMSQEGQDELNSSYLSFNGGKDSAYKHNFVQTALIKGSSIAPYLLASLIPESFAAQIGGRALAAGAGATVNGVLGAGSIMSAATDEVNSLPDTKLQQVNPVYKELRQKYGEDDAREQLINKITGVLPFVGGAINAVAGTISGGTVGKFFKGATAKTILSRAGQEAAANAIGGGAMMGSTAYGTDQATANFTGGKVDWHDVLMESFKGALMGASAGALVGALSKHAPEELQPGEAASVNTAEGQAVNAATHPDMATVPGAEPAKPGAPVAKEPAPLPPGVFDPEHGHDYDASNEEDDKDTDTQPAQPGQATAPAAEQASPVDTATPPPAAAAPVAEAPAAAEPVKPAEQIAPPVVTDRAPDAAPAAPTVVPGKPYVAPEAQVNEQKLSPAKYRFVNKNVQDIAKGVINARPDIANADDAMVQRIMDDLDDQLQNETKGLGAQPVKDIVRAFQNKQSIKSRIDDIMQSVGRGKDDDAEVPADGGEAYPPEAIDNNEQNRVRSADLFKPGNEGALLARINKDEANHTTYARAERMVAERGKAAHSVYHDMLRLRGDGRGGDVRRKSVLLHRARSAEIAQLTERAEAARGKPVLTEADYLKDSGAPLGEETREAFWARMQRAITKAEDGGLDIKRGSFLYRARAALRDAEDRFGDSEQYTGRAPIPAKSRTDQFTGEEFEARHPEFVEQPDSTIDVDPDLLNDDDEPGELAFRADPNAPFKPNDPQTLATKAKNARANPANIKRGGDAMVGRLRLAKGLNKDLNIDSDDIAEIEKIVRFFGKKLMDPIGLSVRKDEHGALGSFNFSTRIVTIYKSALERGELTRTAVHELWHAVETALTIKDKVALRKEYAREYAKFLVKNPWMEAFGTAHKDGTRGILKSISGKAARDFVAEHGSNEDVMRLVDVHKNSSGEVTDIAWKNTGPNYRFTDWHEYFAEKMSDHYFNAEDMHDARAASVMGHLHSFVQAIKNKILRVFGRDASGRIYDGFAAKKFEHRQEAVDAYKSFDDDNAAVAFNRPHDDDVPRGADAIMQGVMRAVNSLPKDYRDHVTDDDINKIHDMLVMLGPHLTKDTGFDTDDVGPQNARGSYDFKTRMVEIYSKAIAARSLGRTAVHELWHSVETALTPRDRLALRTEYTQQLDKMLAAKPWMRDFVNSNEAGHDGLEAKISDEDAADFLNKYGNNESVMSNVHVEKSIVAGRAPTISWLTGKNMAELYRYASVHEYFAEGMTDRFFKPNEIKSPRVKSIMQTLRDFVQRIKDRIKGTQPVPNEFATSDRIYQGFKDQAFTHQQDALEAAQNNQFLQAFKLSPEDAEREAGTVMGKMAKSIDNLYTSTALVPNTFRAIKSGWMNIETLTRLGQDLFHWTAITRYATKSLQSPTKTLEEALNRSGHYAAKTLDKSVPFMTRLANYLTKDTKEAGLFNSILNDASFYDYDPSVAPRPKAAPTSGKGIQQLEKHRAGYADFKKLSGEGQHLFKQMRDVIDDSRDTVQNKLYTTIIKERKIKNARDDMKSGKTPAPLDDKETKAMADRYENSAETQDDKDELGKATHKFLDVTRRAKRTLQNYFPQRRYGTWALTYKDLRPETHVFTNAADMEHFAKTTDLYIRSSRKADYAADGSVIDKDDPAAPAVVRTEHTVNTQNNGVEFFHSSRDAKARREELLNHPTNKYDVQNVQHVRKQMEAGPILNAQGRNLIKALLSKNENATDADKDAVEEALHEALIRALPNNSLRAAALRRNNVMGASKDTMQVLHEYLGHSANAMARLEHAHEINNSFEAMEANVLDKELDKDGKTHIRQELLKELKRNGAQAPMDMSMNGGAARIIRNIQQIQFVQYMFTPRFNMVQLAQPFMTGMPYLGARYGFLKTNAEMVRAMQRVGFTNITGEGTKQMFNAMKSIMIKAPRDAKGYMDIIANHLRDNAKTPQEKTAVEDEIAHLQRLTDFGLTDHGAGLQMQQVLSSVQTNKVARGAAYAEEMARAMPTAIEFFNRSMLALVTRKMELAKGGDEESAFRASADAIQRTQGNYAPANAPRFFRSKLHPGLAPALTFRKYTQFIYALVGSHFYDMLAGESAEVRSVARKTLAGTLFMHAMVAGAHGMPVGSLLMAGALLSYGLGEKRPFNADEYYHKTLASLGVDPKVADVLINGLPALAGFNVTKTMGLDSLIFDQLPKENTKEDWLAMMADTYLGAPGEGIASLPAAIGNAYHGEWMKAASAVAPKTLLDQVKAVRYFNDGVRDSYGDQIAPGLPLNQAIAQSLGFTPDTVEEAYAARQVGTEAKHDFTADRYATLDKFQTAHKEGNAAAATQALKDFNATVPRADRISYSQALRSTVLARKSKQIDGLGFSKKQTFLAKDMAGYNVPKN